MSFVVTRILQRIPIRVIAYPQSKKAKQKLAANVAAHPHSATAAAYGMLIPLAPHWLMSAAGEMHRASKGGLA